MEVDNGLRNPVNRQPGFYSGRVSLLPIIPSSDCHRLGHQRHGSASESGRYLNDAMNVVALSIIRVCSENAEGSSSLVLFTFGMIDASCHQRSGMSPRRRERNLPVAMVHTFTPAPLEKMFDDFHQPQDVATSF